MAETKKTTKKVEKKAATLEEKRKELQKTVLAVRSGEEKDTSKVRKIRKDIARLLTNLNKK